MTDYDNYNTNGVVTRDTWDYSNMPEQLRLDRIRGKDHGRGRAIPFNKRDVETILRLRRDGMSLLGIGTRFDVSEKTVSRVLREAKYDERDRDTTTDSQDATRDRYLLPQRSQRGGWRGK